jgi:hypothetical protein
VCGCVCCVSVWGRMAGRLQYTVGMTQKKGRQQREEGGGIERTVHSDKIVPLHNTKRHGRGHPEPTLFDLRVETIQIDVQNHTIAVTRHRA